MGPACLTIRGSPGCKGSRQFVRKRLCGEMRTSTAGPTATQHSDVEPRYARQRARSTARAWHGYRDAGARHSAATAASITSTSAVSVPSTPSLRSVCN